MKDDRPLFAKLGETFKPMEVLALMKGDLSKVPDLAKRCQEFLKSMIGSQNPAKFSQESCEKIHDMMITPDDLISDEFFPTDCVLSIMEEHLPRMMNYIQTFSGSDEQFAEAMKDMVTDLVTVLVIELESGFGNFADVQKFVKANVDELLTEASEPKNAKLTVMLGSPAIVGFFTKCNENKPQTQQQ